MPVMYAICMTHVQKVLNSCWLSFILYISLFHSLGNNELSPNSLYKIQYRVNKTCITKFMGKLENPSAIMRHVHVHPKFHYIETINTNRHTYSRACKQNAFLKWWLHILIMPWQCLESRNERIPCYGSLPWHYILSPRSGYHRDWLPWGSCSSWYSLELAEVKQKTPVYKLLSSHIASVHLLYYVRI